MKKTFCTAISVLTIFFLASCISVQGPAEQWQFAERAADRPDAVFENDVLPYIIEQLNHTAATFFYDLSMYNRSRAERGLPPRRERVGNVIVGRNEIGGVCQDYASHFIDNYRGLGEIYFVSVCANGEARLLRRIKPFEKSDIEEHIRINLSNFQSARSREKEEFIAQFYSGVIRTNQEMSNRGGASSWQKSFHSGSLGLHIDRVNFFTNKHGKLFLMEETLIPTPVSHAGRTEGFFNHAWVRIVWRDMTIDVEPTWFDNGLPLELGVIAEIVPGRINTFPTAFSSFSELPNTRLISPITGTLRAGDNYTFIISSTGSRIFSVIINDARNDFTRNNETGNFELHLTIPENVDTITIFEVRVSGLRQSWEGLIQYNVIPR